MLSDSMKLPAKSNPKFAFFLTDWPVLPEVFDNSLNTTATPEELCARLVGATESLNVYVRGDGAEKQIAKLQGMQHPIPLIAETPQCLVIKPARVKGYGLSGGALWIGFEIAEWPV